MSKHIEERCAQRLGFKPNPERIIEFLRKEFMGELPKGSWAVHLQLQGKHLAVVVGEGNQASTILSPEMIPIAETHIRLSL